MEDKVTEKFSCPVCFEIPEQEIFQCKNGHTVCHQCSNNLSKCPQCRTEFEKPKIRCRALEDLLDMMKFDCGNKSLGCTTKLPRNQIQGHTKTCPYAGHSIKLCELLGYSCDFTINTKSLLQAMTHLKDNLYNHEIIICRHADIDINLEDFQGVNTTENEWDKFTPIAVDMITEYGKLFILLNQINGIDQTLSFTCLEISEEKTECQKSGFSTQLTIESTNLSKMPNIILSINPMHVKYAAGALWKPVHQFSLLRLKQYYMQNGILVAKCSIKASCSEERAPISSHVCNYQNDRSNVAKHSMASPVDTSNNIFVGVDCFRCNAKPILGSQYVCLNCHLNNNLCKSCHYNGADLNHYYCVIRNMEQNNAFNRVYMESNPTNTFLKPRKTTGISREAEQSTSTANRDKCSRCSNFKRYICLMCKILTGYCNDCFDSVDHPSEHFFAVTETNKKMNVVIQKVLEHEFDTVYAVESLRFMQVKF